MNLFKTKNIATLFFTAALITLAGCKKTLDINHSPNNPSLEVGTAKIVFPVSVMGVAAVEGGDMAIIGGLWGEYITQGTVSNQYKNVDQFDMKTTDYNAQYSTLYTFGLKNVQFVIDKARDAEDWNFYLMGNVIKAYATALLVDMYDQIPYTEALQGLGNLTPKFDDGYTIYKSLIAGIDSALGKDFTALTAIDLRATKEGNVDLIFGGDIEKWKRFANTLELKLYLRMINAKPAEAQAGIEALYARDAQFLEDDAKVTGFSDNPNLSNPLYEQNIRQLNTPNNLVASRTFVSYLQAHNDPRIEYFFGANPTPLDQGDFVNTSPAALAATVFIEDPTDPVVFLSAAESYFLQAEARERYYAGDGAKEAYNNGVLASFSALGDDGSSFVAAGGDYEYPSGTLNQNIEAIIVQKWVSFGYGLHFIEAWFERNRTGYPRSSPVYSDDPDYETLYPGQFVIPRNSVLGNQYPKRLVFPDLEISTNPNTPAQVPITTPVWWGL